MSSPIGTSNYFLALQSIEKKIDQSEHDDTTTVKYAQEIFAQFENSISPTILDRNISADPAYVSEVKTVYERVINKLNRIVSSPPPVKREEFEEAALRLLRATYEGVNYEVPPGEKEYREITFRLFREDYDESVCSQILTLLQKSHLDTDIGHIVVNRLYKILINDSESVDSKGLNGPQLIKFIKDDPKLLGLFAERDRKFAAITQLFPENERSTLSTNQDLLNSFKKNADYTIGLIQLFPVKERLANLKSVSQFTGDLVDLTRNLVASKTIYLDIGPKDFWLYILPKLMVLPEERRLHILIKLQKAVLKISKQEEVDDESIKFYVNLLKEKEWAFQDRFLLRLFDNDGELLQQSIRFVQDKIKNYETEGDFFKKVEEIETYQLCCHCKPSYGNCIANRLPSELSMQINEFLLCYEPRHWSSDSRFLRDFTKASNLIPREKRASLKKNKKLILALHKSPYITFQLLKLIPIEERYSRLKWLFDTMKLGGGNKELFFSNILRQLDLIPEELRFSTLDEIINNANKQLLKTGYTVLKDPFENIELKAKVYSFVEKKLDQFISIDRDFIPDDEIKEATPFIENVLQEVCYRNDRNRAYRCRKAQDDPNDFILQPKQHYQLALYKANKGEFSKNSPLFTLSEAQKTKLDLINNANAAKKLLSSVLKAGEMWTFSSKIQHELNVCSYNLLHLEEGSSEWNKLKTNYPMFKPYIEEIEVQINPIHMESQINWLLLFMYLAEKFEISEQVLADSKPVIEQIMRLRDPGMRFHLTGLLIYQVYFQASNEKWNSLKAIFSQRPHTQLLQLALLPFYASDKINSHPWKLVANLLSSSEFKDASRHHIVLKALKTLSDKQQAHLTPELRNRLLFRAFSQNEKESNKTKAKSTCQNLQLIDALVNTNRTDLLTDDPKMIDIENILQTHLKEAFGLENVQNLAEKYTNTMATVRYPNAFWIYASSINRLEASEKDQTLNAFKIFTEGVLEGTYKQNRYEETVNSHLETLFKTRPDLKKDWMEGDRASFTSLVNIEKIDKTQEFDVVKYLHTRICIDTHISPESFSFLSQCLINPNDLITKDALRAAISTLEQEIKSEGISPERTKKRDRLEFQHQLITMLDKNLTQKEKLDLLSDKILPLCPKLFESQATIITDLVDLQSTLRKALDPARKQYVKWTVSDTDDWQDMLLVGTEVSGSCQRINGDCQLNKCLTSYLIDGKNRAIVVKNEGGQIIARSILRMLYDPISQQPVLFCERTYYNPGISEVEADEAILAMCVKRAKSMGLSLLQNGSPKGADDFYANPIVSLGSNAPSEYVDAGGKGVTSGAYELPTTAFIKIMV